jgi:hypothetical protein
MGAVEHTAGVCDLVASLGPLAETGYSLLVPSGGSGGRGALGHRY